MLKKPLNLLRGHWQMALLLCLIYALWDTDVIQPLRILIVFLHELSHAIMTLLTGGSVEDFAVRSNESGHVLSRGGNRFLILTSGYLGSLLIGVFFFLIAVRTRWDQALLGLFGAVVILITLLYVRTLTPFAFGLATGCIMIAIAWFLNPTASDLILRVIGMTSMLYVPFDIFADTIKWSSQRSDARMLAEEFGGATVLWGGLWLVISLVVIAATLRYGVGENSNIKLKRPAPERADS